MAPPILSWHVRECSATASAQYGASNFPRTVSPTCVDFTRSPYYAQRGHDASSTVPSLRSVHPPSPHEVGRHRRREEGVYTKALTHALRIVRAHIRAEEARWRSICFLSLQPGKSGGRLRAHGRRPHFDRRRELGRGLHQERYCKSACSVGTRAARVGEHAAAAAVAAGSQQQ